MIEALAAVVRALIGVASTLIACRDDLEEIVVVDNRSMRERTAQPCLSVSASPAIEWDSELEFGRTGGMPCPLLAAGSSPCAGKYDDAHAVDAAR